MTECLNDVLHFSDQNVCVFVFVNVAKERFFFHFQQREADFSRKIIDIQQLRVTPEYFMVGYYGKGFPLFLSVSCFVFFVFNF